MGKKLVHFEKKAHQHPYCTIDASNGENPCLPTLLHWDGKRYMLKI